MSDKHTPDKQSKNTSISRRRILSTSLTGLGVMGMTGISSAASKGQSSQPLVDPSEFEAEITSTNSAVKEAQAYANAESATSLSSSDTMDSGPSVGTEAIAELNEDVYVATIPDTVPEIGGTDIHLTFNATFGLTEVSVSVGICFDSFCLTLLGAGISYSNAEICGDIRGKLKTIPLRVEGCFTFAPSLNPAGLEVGASVEACLDLPKMEEIYERDGWEWTRQFLCVSEDVSATL